MGRTKPNRVLLFLGLVVVFYLTVTGRWVYSQTDDTAPETFLNLSPADPDGQNGWYRSPVNVTLTATDLESGVKSIFWRLDSGSWSAQDFSGTLNLAPNPSFEDGGGVPVAWQFTGPSGNMGVWDGTTAKFGTHSLKINAVTNGWSGWSNQTAYVVVQSFASYSASVWVKTTGVLGNGAYFKVYLINGSGQSLLAASTAVAGTNNWTLLSLSFTVPDSQAYGAYLDLGIDGAGTAWYDGLYMLNNPSPTKASLTLAQNGTHSLEYYSADQVGNEELPHHQLNLKMDTVSPYNWRNFSSTKAGNDHTLVSQITVDDPTSGLDQNNLRFQYSTDGGSSWGYYPDPSSCHGNWASGGWLANLSTSGTSNSLTLATPVVDFCNSNWAVCKIVRFKARDMAGNESTKDICINGAWFKVSSGDTYAAAGISMDAAGAGDNTDGLILTSGTVSNFSSSRNFTIVNYPEVLERKTYEEYFAQFSALTPITTLPSASGFYFTPKDFTIDRKTLPANLATASFGAIIFINGDLIINSDYALGNSGALIFIAAGDVLVDSSVTGLAGVFSADGKFDTAYNGGGNINALTIRGSVAAENLVLSRSLKNNDSPAETFIFEPKYYLLLNGAFGSYNLLWREVNL